MSFNPPERLPESFQRSLLRLAEAVWMLAPDGPTADEPLLGIRKYPVASLYDSEIFEILLRDAGCACEKPLYGYKPGVGPRCRLCGAIAQVRDE